MAEQTFTLHYLGCSTLSKGTTGLGLIQKPLKEHYFNFRKKITKTPVEVYMQISRNGLNVLAPDGAAACGTQLKTTHYEFNMINYMEAVQFTTNKNNNRKTQYAFIPLDEKRNFSSPDKLFSTLEKKNNYLLKVTHQPIVVCLMRRQSGLKALDCHVFISLSATDAMKIVDNFTHLQQQSMHNEYMGEFRSVSHKSSPNEQDSARVVQQHQISPQDYTGGHSSLLSSGEQALDIHNERYQLRDEYFRRRPEEWSPIVNDRVSGVLNQHQLGKEHTHYEDSHERNRQIPYYNQQQLLPSKSPSSSPQNLRIHHSRENSYEDESNRRRDCHLDSHYGYQRYDPPTSYGQENLPRQSSRAAGYDRPVSENRFEFRGSPSADRTQLHFNHPQGQIPVVEPNPRLDPAQAVSTKDLRPQHPGRSGPTLNPYNPTLDASHLPRHESQSLASKQSDYNGPTYSLSNLESRQQFDDRNNNSMSTEGGCNKPIAKVPPHKIAGVKVLPTAFEMPKRPTSPKPTFREPENNSNFYPEHDALYWEKHNVQLRYSNTNAYSSDTKPQESNYNDYLCGQLATKDKSQPKYSSSTSDYYRNNGQSPSQNEIYNQYHNRYSHDFGQHGNPSVPERRYAPRNIVGLSEDDRREFRDEAPVRRPYSYYGSEQPKVAPEMSKPKRASDDLTRKKEAEISSMFQIMEIKNEHIRPHYASQADLNFEQSLGYYP